MPKKISLDLLNSLDWSKRNNILAKENNICTQIISLYRKKLNKPKATNFSQNRLRSIEKWQKWDWTKNNCILAKENNISGEAVRQIRLLLSKPKVKPLIRKYHLSSQTFKISQLHEKQLIDWSKTDKELSKYFNLSQYSFMTVRKKDGLPFSSFLNKLLSTKDKISSIDWSLKNREIAQILGFKSITRISQLRRKLNKRTPRGLKISQTMAALSARKV